MGYMSEPNLAQAPVKHWIVPFTATVFAMMTLQMSSLGFSPLLPDIQRDFGVNYSQVGLFSGIYGLAAIVLVSPAECSRNASEKKSSSGSDCLS